MEFYGYTNNTIKLEYDINGFLILDKTEYIEFQSPYHQNETYSMSISCLQKNETHYTYDLSIIKESNYGNSVAFGKVKIYYDESGITSILVNDEENAYLHDRYDDCFDISPEAYRHLLYNKSI
jgi:hypothetical protein